MCGWTDSWKIANVWSHPRLLLFLAALLISFTSPISAFGAPDEGFTISASPSFVKLYQGSSGSTAISVSGSMQSDAELNYAITSPLPAGVTAYFMNDLDGAGAVLTLVGNDFSSAGEATLTISATSRYAEATTTVGLSVASPLYVLSVSPIPFSLSDGSSGVSVASVVPLGNFMGQVDLSAPHLPTGVNVAFSPTSTSGKSQLSWTVSDSAPSGSSPVMIFSSSGGTFSAALFDQVITPEPMPTFTLGVSPAYVLLEQGSASTDTITITESNGFRGDLNLSATQLPAGVSAEFSPNSTSTQSTLTLSATNTALPGNYEISVWGFSQDQTQTTISPLFVAIKPRPLFAISAVPSSASVLAGQSTSFNIAVAQQGGFTDAVGLSISSILPEGVSVSFGTNPTRQSTSIVISAASSAVPGAYFLDIEASSGSSATIITVPLTIERADATATPTFSVPAGTYSSAQLVSISDGTADATVYYSIDGSEPNVNSPVYAKAISIQSSETLHAMAVAPDAPPSQIAAASYIIDMPSNPIPEIGSVSPAFISAGGPAISVTVKGANFVASSSVLWNNRPLATQFISESELIAQVPASETANVQGVDLFVETPSPGGGTSNKYDFQVDSPSSSTSLIPLMTPSTQSISAGSRATYDVELPSSMTAVSAVCLNLPSGASCLFEGGKLTISTASTSPAGIYQITAVFSGSLANVSSSDPLFPMILIPAVIGRRKRGRRRSVSLLLLALTIATMFQIGCGGRVEVNSTTASTNITTSSTVGLTIH